eukprot:scaffold157122_cov31-Tisochrysis_lutea.AAC.1
MDSRAASRDAERFALRSHSNRTADASPICASATASSDLRSERSKRTITALSVACRTAVASVAWLRASSAFAVSSCDLSVGMPPAGAFCWPYREGTATDLSPFGAPSGRTRTPFVTGCSTMG